MESSATSADGSNAEARTVLAKFLKRAIFTGLYSRGVFHYDVMVTLILLFIFVTPHLWKYGDRPSSVALSHPIQVTGDGGNGIILTVAASDVDVPQFATDQAVKKALRQAIMPVTGDAVSVERWETVTDTCG